MSVLADKIEQFILHKLLEEDEENIVLRRNELADELDCAPSQISYVLSTRFSNDKGYLVESRRGSGVFCAHYPTDSEKTGPDTGTAERNAAGCQYYDGRSRCAALYRLIKSKSLTNREAILLHHTFEALFDEVDEPQRLAVIGRILRTLNLH